MSKATCPIAMLLLFVLACPCTQAQQKQNDKKRFLRWSYGDVSSLARGTQSNHFLVSSGALIGLSVLSTQDQNVVGYVQDNYEGSTRSFLDAVNQLGDTKMLPAAGGIFLLTLATDNTKLQDAAFTSLESIFYAHATASVLKTIMGRARPEEAHGAHRFRPFSGYTSFPSGHTTTAFALITPWVLYYPNVATYGLFILGTGTAIARMAQDKHWMTDVITGGAIGFLVGYGLSKIHLHDADAHFDLSPRFSFNGVGLSARLKL